MLMLISAQQMYRPFDLVTKYLHELAVIAVNAPGPMFTSENWLTIWNGADIRLCTDGAANSLIEPCRSNKAKYPELIVGDFDSITAESKKFFGKRNSTELIHVADQNSTDLTKTLNALMEKKTPNAGILLLGGFTGRLDHVFAVLNSMVLQAKSTPLVPIFALDGQNVVAILPQGKTDIQLCVKCITGICGLIPIVQRKTVVSSEGLKWELNERELEFGGLVSSSNQILQPQTLRIRCNEPIVFTFELKQTHSILCCDT